MGQALPPHAPGHGGAGSPFRGEPTSCNRWWVDPLKFPKVEYKRRMMEERMREQPSAWRRGLHGVRG